MPNFRSEELADWTGGVWTRQPQNRISGISHDSRTIGEGDLYIAIAGERYDGHEFVGSAFKRGASGAVVQAEYSGSDDQLLLRVAETACALRDIARSYRATLTGKIFAITGSVGKTTVKEMLAQILGSTTSTAATKGNWNNFIGLPLSLLAMEREDTFGVFEVAMNCPGEIRELCDILQPDYGIMTPVGIAHCERFSSREEIPREKAAMLASLPANGFAILSQDQDWYSLFRESTIAPVRTVSMTGEADYTGRMRGERELEVRNDGKAFDLELPFAGEHVGRDALLAVAAALEVGVSPATAAQGVESMDILPMRGECVQLDGVDFVNDAYNANPLSMKAAIRSFAGRECPGRSWLVLGGMHELGREAPAAHVEVGRFAADYADFIVAVGDYANYISEGVRAGGHRSSALFECSDARAAAKILDGESLAGDSVLLKASRAEHLEKILDYFKNSKQEERT